MALKLLHQDETMACGQKGPLFVVSIRSDPGPANIRALGEAEAKVVADAGRVLVLVILGTYESHGERAGIRDEAAALMKRFEDAMAATAIVITGAGLMAMLKRMVVTGVLLLARNKSPMKIFADAAEAVRWLQHVPGQPATLASDAGLVEEVTQFVAEWARPGAQAPRPSAEAPR